MKCKSKYIMDAMHTIITSKYGVDVEILDYNAIGGAAWSSNSLVDWGHYEVRVQISIPTHITSITLQQDEVDRELMRQFRNVQLNQLL